MCAFAPYGPIVPLPPSAKKKKWKVKIHGKMDETQKSYVLPHGQGVIQFKEYSRPVTEYFLLTDVNYTLTLPATLQTNSRVNRDVIPMKGSMNYIIIGGEEYIGERLEFILDLSSGNRIKWLFQFEKKGRIVSCK